MIHADAPVGVLVVPFEGGQLVVGHFRKGVNDVCAQERIGILGEKTSLIGSILRPVRIIADHILASFFFFGAPIQILTF